MSAILNLMELNFFRTYHSLKPHILFYSNGLASWHNCPDITHMTVNNGCQSDIFNFIRLNQQWTYHSLKPHILFYSNGLASWHNCPDITHMTVNNGCQSDIFNFIRLSQQWREVSHFEIDGDEILHCISLSLKQYIFFDNNSLIDMK